MTLFNAGLEAIHFQADKYLFKTLVNVITEIRESVSKKETVATDKKHSERLSTIIKESTGLYCEVTIDHHEPCCMPPNAHVNNPLIEFWKRRYYDSGDGITAIKKAGERAHGKVNIKNATVSGVFSELKTSMWMPEYMFSSNEYTPGEVAAIMLHETGHLFTWFECVSRTITTNHVLSGLAKALDKTSSVYEKEVVLALTKDVLDLKKLDPKEAAKSSNTVIETLVISNIIEETRSELGTGLWDTNTYEYLSDEFATRMGAGRELISGLDKLMRKYNAGDTWNPIAFHTVTTIRFLTTIGAIFTGAAIMVGATSPLLLPIFYVSFIAGFLLPGLGDGTGGNTYDRMKDRYNRVKHQLIERIKDKTLPDAIVEEIHSDIQAVDKMMSGLYENVSLIDHFFNAMSKAHKLMTDQKKLQQQLEEFANNELFISASKLSLTAKGMTS